jgi:ABC-type multidrug transport system ATPase subunit
MAGMLPGTMTSASAERSVVRSVAFAPQRPRLPQWLTAREIALLYGIPWSAFSRLEGLMLDEIRDVRAAHLSDGQAQILSVALVLLSGALIMLLDEPFAALDFRRRIALSRVLSSGVPAMDGTRSAIVVASPAVGDLVETCSWMVAIVSGRYAVSGPVSDLVDVTAPIESRQHQIEQRLMSMLDPVDAAV